MSEKMDHPCVSVIVPVHNGGGKFHACVDSLLKTADENLEIIAVADGESDGSWRYAAGLGIKVIELKENGGPAIARNIGAQQAKCDILLFIDADIVVRPDTVTKVRTAFENDPALAALFGSYDDEPFEKNMLSQYRNLMHHFVHQHANSDASTFWSGCGAIRRHIFLDLGGFSREFLRPSVEDIELGYRLKKAGHRIRLERDIVVKHLKYWDAKSILKTDFFCRAIPWTQLILKYNLFVNDLNVKMSDRLSVSAAFIFIFTMCMSFWQPWMFIFAQLSAGMLLSLNWEFYRFLIRKRGLAFFIKALPWHWIYFVQSGVAFSLCYVTFKLKKKVVRS